MRFKPGWYEKDGFYRYLYKTTIFGMLEYQTEREIAVHSKKRHYIMPSQHNWFPSSVYLGEDKAREERINIVKSLYDKQLCLF